ncbi:MAG: hypothetical protein GX950_02200 [Candidatus Diapherotrites archaeon]|uniref:Uncharacterized protein n=1 Tax=Candidatus Iainarchaeum sp. TaxID=3101447 RepID=A0A7K4BZU8_9ARCH|nr:hypothetical protein [Candidatus Diapherotrites archaeon]
MGKSFSKNQIVGLLIIISLVVPYIPIISALDPLMKILLFLAAIWLLVK